MEDYSLQDRQSIERFLDVVDLMPVMRRAREEAIGLGYRWPIEIDGLPIKKGDFPWLC